MRVLRISPQSDCWEIWLDDGSTWILWKEYADNLNFEAYGELLNYIGRLVDIMQAERQDLIRYGFQKKT